MYSLTKSSEQPTNVKEILQTISCKNFDPAEILKSTSKSLILILKKYPEVVLKPYSISVGKIKHNEGLTIVPLETDDGDCKMTLKNKNNKLEIQFLSDENHITSYSNMLIVENDSALNDAYVQTHVSSPITSYTKRTNEEVTGETLTKINGNLFELI